MTIALEIPKFDKPVKVLLAVAAQHSDVVVSLVQAATDCLDDLNLAWDRIDVPSASEIAPSIGIAERMANFDGYVALGAILDDGLLHSETEFRDAHHALTLLGLQGLCVGNGLLAVNPNENYAYKGKEAALAALHLIALSRKWGAQRKGIGFKPSFDEYQIASGGTTV